MIPGLYDDQRRTLMRSACALVCGAVVVLPLTMQTTSYASASTRQEQAGSSLPRATERAHLPAIIVSRDPFRPAANAASFLRQMPAGPGKGAGSVRAIVIGEPSRALIEVDGEVRVFGIGDNVNGAAIVGIYASGVLLSNGLRLPVAQSPR